MRNCEVRAGIIRNFFKNKINGVKLLTFYEIYVNIISGIL